MANLTSDYTSIFSTLFDTSFGAQYQATGKLRKVVDPMNTFYNVGDNSITLARAGQLDMIAKTGSYSTDVPASDMSVAAINFNFELRELKSAIGYFETKNFRPDAIPRLAMQHAAALQRFEDQKIITALSAGVPAANVIADSGTNMTTDKLTQAREILGTNNVTGDLWVVMHWKQYKALLKEVEFTQSLFNPGTPLVQANPDTFNAPFAGFNIVVMGDVLRTGTGENMGLPVAANIRDCFAFSSNSLVLGYQQEILNSVTDVPNNARIEVLTMASCGAKAYNETGMVKVQCDETA